MDSPPRGLILGCWFGFYGLVSILVLDLFIFSDWYEKFKQKRVSG